MYTVYNCSMYIIGGNMEPENKHYNQVRTLRVQLPVPEIHVFSLPPSPCRVNLCDLIHVTPICPCLLP